jgi:hypothetical protein
MASLRGRQVAALALMLGCADVAIAQPVNDDCGSATVIASLPFADVVDMTTATTDPGDPVSACSGQGTNSVWYRLPAADAATLFRGEAGGTGSLFSVRAFTGSCGALTEIWCDLTHPSAHPSGPEFGLAPEGQEVLLEVANAGTVGTLDFSLEKADEFLVQKAASRSTAVAGGPNGFLAVWESGPSQAQLFDRTGAPIGAPFDLGAPAPDVSFPSVAAAGDGSFFVVWEGTPPQAVRVDGPGAVVSLPLVSAPGVYPGVAADDAGNFVVVWGGVSAQRFDRDGTPLGGSFQVNTYTTGTQYRASVAMTPTGEFVVAWEGASAGDGDGISARLFDASGTPTTGEFVVNSSTAYSQYLASVATDAAGNFVVAFEANYYYGPPPLENPVELRRFDAAGTPLGPDFIVTTEEYYISGHIHVASAANGEFMVSWETYDTNHSSFVDNAARRFDPDGTPQGPQFFAGNFGGYAHYDPSVGATSTGDFLIVWNDYDGFFNARVPGTPADAIIARAFPTSFGCATAALAGCGTPTVPRRSKLLLQNSGDDAADLLRWKVVKGTATDAAAFGDPTTGEDYALCLYDASSVAGALLFEARAPAGGTCGTKPCWKPLGNPPGSRGYRYKNKARTPNGILKLVLKPGIEGKAKVIVSGGRERLFTGAAGAPTQPLALPVVMQLQNASGECWQATYDTDGLGINEAGFFRGSGS